MRSFRGVGPCVTLPTHCIWPAVRLQYGCSMGWFVEKFRKKILFCHLVAFCRFYQSTTTARPSGKKHFCRTHRAKHPCEGRVWAKLASGWDFRIFLCHGGCHGGWVRVTLPQKIMCPKNAPNASPMRNKWPGTCVSRKKIWSFLGVPVRSNMPL